MIRILLFLAITILSFLKPLHADDEVVKGRFVVSFVAKEEQSPWLVSALEKNVYNDLAGYARIISVNKDNNELSQCPERSISCLIKLYQKLNIDALMLGEVNNSDIDYKVYDVREESLIESGSVAIGTDSSMLKLRMEAFAAFKPFLEKGGILEQRKFTTQLNNELNEAETSETASFITKYRNLFIIALALFISFPYFLSFLGNSRKNTERVFIIRQYFLPFLLVSYLIIGYPFIVDYFQLSDFIEGLLNDFARYQWLFPTFAGFAWGYFLIINLKIVVPSLQGIERITQTTIFPLIRAFSITLLIKLSFVLLFFSGYFYGIYTFCQYLNFNDKTIFLYVFPLSGLFICYWLGLTLEVFAMTLDVKLVDGQLDFNSMSHKKIKKYLIGYLKRNGVTLNKQLVDNIVFLPGKNKGVISYGGGFGRPRIVIEKRLIDFAISRDTEKKLIKRKYRHTSAFNLQPNLNPDKKKKLFSMSDQKRESIIKKIASYFASDINLRQSHSNSRAGKIKGLILPEFQPQDDLPSLMSDNFDDMQVVEALLLEDALLNEPYDEDAEIDDASMDDKDFLFGIIMHKLGGLLRNEHIFSTPYFYFRYKKGEKKKSYNFFFSRYFSIISDTFVVLNFGLHHLIQHLYYQVSEDAKCLTTRRMSNYVLESQDKILTAVKEVVDNRKPKLSRTDEYDRIVWLSKFCAHPLNEKKSVILRRSIKWASVLAFVSLVAWIGFESYQYHPEYLRIIQDEEQAIQEAIEKSKEEEEKDNDERK
ncbi:hypothetical protein [Pleionea sediminis]|uniref:hypothetical protein n=1 Tax=Pleionea sediminis TaxID=2569479 RepID=UPI001185B2EE|nr:hypothetical protein [Pleionea sediminis]